VCVAGYVDSQFSGVVKRVRLNGQSVKLSDLPTNGQTEVVPCSAAEVKDFITQMKEQKQHYIENQRLDSVYSDYGAL